ncbi:Motile sperm domain-containing protein 1 [Trichoplax sp. H2]|nr:Motile sperm domain-containing protein 1 [Trichoplax sp. H2]|eukprot:RDD46052.1 Motile sperm domain-containing protein 1 [Trichoplax sp. H2]
MQSSMKSSKKLSMITSQSNNNNNNITVENVPVFAFPTTLSFIENDKSSYKQILTIYNTYDFTVRFKVLSNCPSNYVLSDSEGLIKTKCRVDILIRFNDENPLQDLHNNKFRIQLYEHGVDKIIGKRDIKVAVESGSTADNSDNRNSINDNSQSFMQRHGSNNINGSQDSGINVIVVLLAIICIAILLLPLPEEKAGNVPTFLHVPVTYKLIASFLLGMVTLAVLRN